MQIDTVKCKDLFSLKTTVLKHLHLLPVLLLDLSLPQNYFVLSPSQSLLQKTKLGKSSTWCHIYTMNLTYSVTDLNYHVMSQFLHFVCDTLLMLIPSNISCAVLMKHIENLWWRHQAEFMPKIVILERQSVQ